MKKIFPKPIMVAGILLGGFTTMTALAGDPEQKVIVVASADAEDSPAPPAAPPAPGQQRHVIVRTMTHDGAKSGGKEQTWLGVGVEETSEALAAQLDLKPGQGLVANYIATNSPAAAAGLKKNDVLLELDGQMLVDASQLRKLVQMRAEGDSVKIVYYRAGKKETASAKLAKKVMDDNLFEGDVMPGLGNLQFHLQGLHGAPVAAGGNLNIEVQRTMEQARRAVEEAMRQSGDATDGAHRKLEIVQRKLGNLAEGGVSVGKNATVIVKNEGESVRTMVKKDETGSYVIVADPAKHLTAHDANDKLLFDGAIETPEQQQKVPKEVWKKVEPMLEQMKKDTSAGGRTSVQSSSQDN